MDAFVDYSYSSDQKSTGHRVIFYESRHFSVCPKPAKQRRPRNGWAKNERQEANRAITSVTPRLFRVRPNVRPVPERSVGLDPARDLGNVASHFTRRTDGLHAGRSTFALTACLACCIPPMKNFVFRHTYKTRPGMRYSKMETSLIANIKEFTWIKLKLSLIIEILLLAVFLI